MSELKHFAVKNICTWPGQCEKCFSRNTLQREVTGLVPILQMVVEESGRDYLPSFNTSDCVLKKIVFGNIATENWVSVLIGGERKQEVVPRLCIH